MTSPGSAHVSARSPRAPIGFDAAKRAIDVVVGAAILILTAPLQVLVALGVRAKLGKPVIFRQLRPGHQGRCFELRKFRTMLPVDVDRGVVTNEQRMTTLGRLLRATSMDELPSMWNVLRGDLSLVGPRPLRTEYLELYSATQARRHEVKPGVTGWAQVHGRNALSWDDRLSMDVWYVDHRSLRLDFRIMVETIRQVLRPGETRADGVATMSAFVGSDSDPGLVEQAMDDRFIEERVRWLSDPRVSAGVSLSFQPTVDGMRSWLERVRAQNERRDLVYLLDGRQPVAMAGLSGVGTADLWMYLYVDPDEHGKGYGGRTLDKLVRLARSLGARRLHLEVKETNDAAVRLYSGAGFNPDKTLDAPPGKVAMTLALRTDVVATARP